MRRTTLASLALTLSLAGAAGAQAPVAGHWSLGPFAGLNYTTFYGSDAQGEDSRSDFAVGGQFDYDFIGGGLFRTGLLYSRRGAQTTESGITDAVKINYIEIPVLFGFRFPTTAAVKPYVMGGGQLGFKSGCTVEESGGGSSISAGCDETGGDFSSTDLALVGGAGIAVPVGLSNLAFDVRYSVGLIKIEKNSEVKNRGFTFGVAYMIPVGR
jgi:hypothetical protein